MDAGPELDAAIAERVMGWQREAGRPPWWWWHVPETETLSTRCAHDGTDTTPSYSTDIAAAMAIPVKMDELGLIDGFCRAVVDLAYGWNTRARTDPSVVVAFLTQRETAPEIICQAALAVLGAE